jgi:hypothetical protein
VTSLRGVLNSIGVTRRDVSVLRHFLGFTQGQMPRDPEPGVTAQVSLNAVVRSLRGRHFHMNVIRVGYDAIPAADRGRAFERLDYAVYKARNVLRARGMGIGRIERYAITAADANGADDIGSQSEAQDLWRGWSVRNDGLDVFVVRTISTSDFIGLSPVGGSCNKNSKNSGLLGGGNNRDFDGLARTFAHEIGHFLGLSHNHGSNCPTTAAARANLMAQTRCTDSVRDGTVLTAAQGTTINGHCSVRTGVGV